MKQRYRLASQRSRSSITLASFHSSSRTFLRTHRKESMFQAPTTRDSSSRSMKPPSCPCCLQTGSAGALSTRESARSRILKSANMVQPSSSRVSRGATASGPKTLSRRVGDTAQAVCHQHTRTREIRRRFSNPRTAEMSRRLPPSNRLMWGFNISAWKNGFHWLDADEACDAGSIARSVCADPAQILEVRSQRPRRTSSPLRTDRTARVRHNPGTR